MIAVIYFTCYKPSLHGAMNLFALLANSRRQHRSETMWLECSETPAPVQLQLRSHNASLTVFDPRPPSGCVVFVWGRLSSGVFGTTCRSVVGVSWTLASHFQQRRSSRLQSPDRRSSGLYRRQRVFVTLDFYPWWRLMQGTSTTFYLSKEFAKNRSVKTHNLILPTNYFQK